MYIVPINDDKFFQVIKIIKLGKNLCRNLENLCWNTFVGHWNSYVGIPMWVFQLQPRNSEAREPTNE